MAAQLQPEPDYWEVPRGCWEGEAVALLCGGSSLTQEMADYCRGRCRVVAINRAGVPRPEGHQGRWVYAPWADWLFAPDVDRFWAWHPEAIDFPGVKIVVRKIVPSREQLRGYARLAERGVKVLRHSGHKHPIAMGVHEGISHDPAIVHGNNAAFMLMSVLHHTGATTVLPLGLDVKSGHWHGGYISGSEPDYALSIAPNFRTLVGPLAKAGVAVLLASERSALKDLWPVVKLEDVI